MSDTVSTTTDHVTPACKWTHTGSRVRILKCVNADGTSYQGFQWPLTGPVTPAHWSREATVESGGLFGWPWGLAFGDGKEPDYRTGRWIVFEAHPDDVIDLNGKCKAVPNPEAERTPEVIYAGSFQRAWELILPGQIAWIQHASRGAASATSWSGAASATGERGAASATGERSIASSTGECGAVEATNTGIAASTAEECWWHVVEGCLFLQRWKDGHRLCTTADVDARTGDRVRFVRGVVVEHVRVEKKGGAQ